jgi:hypothetical protein
VCIYPKGTEKSQTILIHDEYSNLFEEDKLKENHIKINSETLWEELK